VGSATAAPPSPRTAPREGGRRQYHRDHGPLNGVDVQVISASAELDRLEDAGDAVRLRLLAVLYRERAELSRRYSELLTLARRLSAASHEYDQVLKATTADDVAAELQAAGVLVLNADGIGSSPDGQLEASKVFVRLSRIAAEAAQGLKAHHQLGELLGVAQ
jgi:hypothetical protein